MGKSHRTCKDKSTDAFPTCGWHINTQTGDRLADSQGFCCGCSMSNAMDQSIDGSLDGSGISAGGGSEFRAKLDCNVFRTGLPLQAAAHCMMHGSEWYSGYNVGSSRTEFDIFVDVSVGRSPSSTVDDSGESMSTTLRLGPDVLLNRTADGFVIAELLGDLSKYASNPVLNGKYLMIPPKNSEGLLAPREDWLLLDKTMVTLDGSECDKVGVSFGTFRGQPTRCYRAPGTCLRNQIKDILEEEEKRMQLGIQPLYLLKRYGTGISTMRSNEERDRGSVRLRIPVISNVNSVITLTLDATDLVETINTSPGEILNVFVTGFTPVPFPFSQLGNSTAEDGGFEALTGSGRVQMRVINTGSIAAEYFISITNCTMGVERVINPGPLVLLPNEPQDLALVLAVDSHEADTSRSCSAILQNAIGITIDTKTVSFYTNATTLDSSPQNLYIPNPATAFNGPNTEKGKLTCADHCPSTFNSVHFTILT